MTTPLLAVPLSHALRAGTAGHHLLWRFRVSSKPCFRFTQTACPPGVNAKFQTQGVHHERP